MNNPISPEQALEIAKEMGIDPIPRYLTDFANAVITKYFGEPVAQHEVGEAVALPAIERDEEMDRTYIPLPGNWEIQTKGKGSTFRLAKTDGTDERWPILESMLHEPLERMAREIRAAYAPPLPQDARELLEKAAQICHEVGAQHIDINEWRNAASNCRDLILELIPTEKEPS